MPGTNINVGGAAGYKEGNKWGKGEGRQWYLDVPPRTLVENADWFNNPVKIKGKVR